MAYFFPIIAVCNFPKSYKHGSFTTMLLVCDVGGVLPVIADSHLVRAYRNLIIQRVHANASCFLCRILAHTDMSGVSSTFFCQQFFGKQKHAVHTRSWMNVYLN